MRSCFSRAEAPHGEPAHHVAGKGGVKPYRVRIRVPSLPNMLNSTSICYGLKSTHMPVVLDRFRTLCLSRRQSNSRQRED